VKARISKSPALCRVDEKRSRPISRVLSRTIIHLGCTSPCTSSDLPGSLCGPHVRPTSEDLDRLLPYLVLLRAGFAVPPSVATGAVRSYRTLSPLPAPPRGWRLGGLLSVALSVGSRPPGVTWRPALGARTFLHACAQRLPGRLRREWWAYPDQETSPGAHKTFREATHAENVHDTAHTKERGSCARCTGGVAPGRTHPCSATRCAASPLAAHHAITAGGR